VNQQAFDKLDNLKTKKSLLKKWNNQLFIVK
jgi:hypothetical protein